MRRKQAAGWSSTKLATLLLLAASCGDPTDQAGPGGAAPGKGDVACRSAQVIGTHSVWLRREPSVTSGKIRLLSPRTALCVLADGTGELYRAGGPYTAPGGATSTAWYELQSGTERAFVAAAFVELLGQAGDSPWACPGGQAPLGFVVGVSALSSTIDTDYTHHVGLIGNAALVHATPAVDAEVLMQLVEGAALRVGGQAETHGGMSWYPVLLPSLEQPEPAGWIRADQLLVPTSPCREWGPAMREARGATHQWGRYTFALAAEHAYPAKSANIGIAARNVDGMTVGPGAVAGINARWVHLKQGDFFTGWCEGGPCRAGGICGAASTFFRALLRSGLPLVEARSHGSFYDSYGFPGADAMIYAPGSDLRFANDSGGTLVVVAWSEVRAEPAALLTHFALFGTQPRRRTVEIGTPSYSVALGRYELTRRVTRPPDEPPYSGEIGGSLSLRHEDGTELWRFWTTYRAVGWWENLSQQERAQLFDLNGE